MKLEVIKKQDALKMIKEELAKFRAEIWNWVEYKLEKEKEGIGA